jgi:GT2 family glycosyltransferase
MARLVRLLGRDLPRAVRSRLLRLQPPRVAPDGKPGMPGDPVSAGPRPRFSLVVATVGRLVETQRLCESLVAQTFTDFEVIIVDQNVDGLLDGLVAEFAPRLRLIHLRSPRGVSRARNAGLAQANGEIIAFPDDDCWYFADTLERVDLFLADHPQADGVSGRSLFVPESGSRQRFESRAGWVSAHLIWFQVTAFALFLRRRVMESVGGFDESLGPGAGTLWGSAEESDLVMRALQLGWRIRYWPQLRVRHPGMSGVPGPFEAARERSYARAMGHVLHLRGRPWIEVAYFLMRTSAGLVVAWLLRQKWQKMRRRQIVLGIWEGWSGRLGS